MSNLKNEHGQGLVEYILIVVVMGILTVGVIHRLSAGTQKGFNKASSTLETEFN